MYKIAAVLIAVLLTTFVTDTDAVNCFHCRGNLTDCETKYNVVNCGDLPYCFILIDNAARKVVQSCASLTECQRQLPMADDTTVASSVETSTSTSTSTVSGLRRRRRQADESTTTGVATTFEQSSTTTEAAHSTTTAELTTTTLEELDGETTTILSSSIVMDCCQDENCNCAGAQCFGFGVTTRPSVLVILAMQLLGAVIVIRLLISA